MKIGDANDIATIYNHYISHTLTTFEELDIEIDGVNKRIKQNLSNNLPWLIAEEKCPRTQDSKMIGYVYASQWKGRNSYRYSVELTIYLSPELKA